MAVHRISSRNPGPDRRQSFRNAVVTIICVRYKYHAVCRPSTFFFYNERLLLKLGRVVKLYYSAVLIGVHCFACWPAQETEYKGVLKRVDDFAEEEGRRPRILVRQTREKRSMMYIDASV